MHIVRMLNTYECVGSVCACTSGEEGVSKQGVVPRERAGRGGIEHESGGLDVLPVVPVIHVLEAGLAASLVQVGVGSFDPHSHRDSALGAGCVGSEVVRNREIGLDANMQVVSSNHKRE